MSGVLRAFRVLALAAMLSMAATSRGAEKRGSTALPTAAEEDGLIEEPILLIPSAPATRTKSSAAAASARAETTRDKHSSAKADSERRTAADRERPAGDSRTDKRVLDVLAPSRLVSTAAGALKSAAGEPSAKRKFDARIMPAAADDDLSSKTTTKTKSAKASSNSTKSRSVIEPRELAAPMPFDGPNPGYHPARVSRKEGGWYLTGAEPGGHEPVPVPVPEVESVSTPESIDGDEFSPFDGAVDGEFIDGFGGDGFGGGGFGGGYGLNGDTFFGGSGGYLPGGRQWAVIGGGEWLMIRPHFSQAVGVTETINTQSGAFTTATHDQHNFNPGYQGAFRTYLGFRNCACGDEVRFGFFNLNAVDNLSGTATANTQFCDFLCNTTPNPGDSVNTHFNLGASLWDLDCVRPFFFNPPCNDCCGPRCHPWDLRWFGGLRIAYINHSISSLVSDARNADGVLATSSAGNRFTGFGLRMGLQARKYFGQQGRFSVYGRGAGSLLIGNDYQSVGTATSTTISAPTASYQYSRNSRLVPVAELEVGGTMFIAPRFALSAGWMLMSFWDLGLQETGSMGTPPLDTSNILGFDGFFLRGELVF